MTEDTALDLVPLAALGALDGEEQTRFEAGRSDPRVQRELLVFERLVGQIGLASDPVPPSPAVRARVMAAAATPPLESRPPVNPSGRPAVAFWLALAAAVVLAMGALTWRTERNTARREAARARAEVETLAAKNRDLQGRLDLTQQRLEVAESFRRLLAQPSTRVALLAGLPAAPLAWGRVVWSADRREAVLLTAGLPPAPAGKAYEAWVIASGPPVAAGVFRTDNIGAAVHALTRLDDVAHAKTFAVTLEPESGTSAPTGPMVLAGPAL
jgi:hypothetical protein